MKGVLVMEFENSGRINYAEIARGIYENADQDIDIRYAPRGIDDGVDTGSLESEVNPTRELGQNQSRDQDSFDLDTALAESELEFSPEDRELFQSLGLKPDHQQKALERLKELTEAPQAYWENQDKSWTEDLTREFGPDLDDAAGQVNQVLSKYDTNGELVKLLDQTGFQNCAPLFKLLHAVSQDLRR
jgi:hypothetical protein